MVSVTGSVKPADVSLLTYLVCSTFAKTGKSGEGEPGFIPSWPLHLPPDREARGEHQCGEAGP